MEFENPGLERGEGGDRNVATNAAIRSNHEVRRRVRRSSPAGRDPTGARHAARAPRMRSVNARANTRVAVVSYGSKSPDANTTVSRSATNLTTHDAYPRCGH